ncbi:MAG: TatD family hydrolase [Prolixibacteraceae bacterium]|jgi:TatD DNase family protein|nr:TatD family hydrolase [Prolixibacteraceae bacterium]
MFVDSHSHIYSVDFSLDRDEVITRALEAGVERIVLPNIDSSSIKPLMDLTDTIPGLFFPLVGLHPTSVKEDFRKELQILEYWLGKRKFYGIGEIGIDLFWDKSFLEEQIEAFTTQIGWAKNRSLPIVIHVRDSFNEVMEHLRKVHVPGLQGVFHSFTGNLEQAEQIIELGFKIGINGIITFKNSDLGETIQKIDPRHLLIETDSPWLAPVPHRGKRNECSYVVTVAEKIAQLHDTSIEKIADITSKNAKEVFGF